MVNVLGLITVNGKNIIEVDANPSTDGGVVAAKGSMAMWDNGSIGRVYIKTSSADTGWQEIDVPEGSDWQEDGNMLTGGAADAPVEFIGSNNDYDMVFKRNGSEQFRLQNLAMLVGLASSQGGRLQVQAASLGDEVMKQLSPAGGVGTDAVIHVTRQYKVATTAGVSTTLATLLVPASARVLVTARIAGNQTGGASGAAGDGAAFKRTFAAKRLAAGGAALGTVQSDYSDRDGISAAKIEVAVNTNSVEIKVIGDTNRNVMWCGHLDILIVGA